MLSLAGQGRKKISTAKLFVCFFSQTNEKYPIIGMRKYASLNTTI
ncbi:hypothetical protein HMPREF9136_0805 [Prevotella dentalis DSM 3688]|uniref:Uncharacterized protein n=1 Tax=Prevotella dentalis (strain ATCC 49559 / DSM 3688 / JCM 13448 / NCTC 12043 / ES 2772) TaxID=908937 RepID=F9D1S7_PREDD|nr:hypothetical protein HMPREF9136_0805 [Prevotella dentalis DSM 3688]